MVAIRGYMWVDVRVNSLRACMCMHVFAWGMHACDMQACAVQQEGDHHIRVYWEVGIVCDTCCGKTWTVASGC